MGNLNRGGSKPLNFHTWNSSGPEFAEAAEDGGVEVVRIFDINEVSNNRSQAFPYEDEVTKLAREWPSSSSGKFYQLVNSCCLSWALNGGDGVGMVGSTITQTVERECWVA